jgi:hypothetical protein
MLCVLRNRVQALKDCLSDDVLGFVLCAYGAYINQAYEPPLHSWWAITPAELLMRKTMTRMIMAANMATTLPTITTRFEQRFPIVADRVKFAGQVGGHHVRCLLLFHPVVKCLLVVPLQ